MINQPLNNNLPPTNRLVTRRKLTVISVIAAFFLFLALYNLGSYFFINKIGRYLEQGLDARLKTIADIAVVSIERDLGDLYDPTEQSLLRLQLERLRAQNNLEAVYIINPELFILADSKPEMEQYRGYIREDSAAIKSVETGKIVTSPLHTVAGNHFKSVYIPIYDYNASSGILVLEASADFFNTIDFFRNGLYLGTLISVILLVLLIVFITWATRLLLKTEQELEKSQRLAAMGQMSATVAHEIRNPLGIIKSTSDVIREKYQNPEEPDEMFDFITEEISRLNRLVNDFLSFSREPRLNPGIHDLGDLIKDAIQTFKSEKFENTQVTLTLNKKLQVNCDKDMLHRVLLNIFINARQAVADGVAEINITLDMEHIRGKNYAVVQISDNGIGIAGATEEIFNPFFTTKTQGTGLGLAVSRSIIEKHGGKLVAANNRDKGATLTFTLPIVSA